MNKFARTIIATATAISLGLLSQVAPIGISTSVAEATPAAGQCSKSTGEWVCNAENQVLTFHELSDGTIQPTAGTTNTIIGATLNSLQTFEYVGVFSDGTITVDADVSITALTGRPDLDENSNATFGKESINVGISSGEDVSFTVDFLNASTGEPVTMQNIEVLVMDIDGGTQDERAVFQGLASYRLATNTILTVNPSSAPSPETGQRIFEGATSAGSDVSDKEAWVSTYFSAVSSLRLRAYASGSGGVVGFKFGDADTSWAGQATNTTPVGYGSYAITYDVNGGSGTGPSPTSGAGSLTLSSGSGLSKSGISISSWNTRADGTGQTFALGSSMLPSGNTTLYAQYVARTVTFNSNGGSGSMSTQTSAGPTGLSSNSFSRTGYTFSGWNTAADGSGADYADGATYPFSISETLYAQWDQEFTVSFDANGGSGSMSGQTSSSSTSLSSNSLTRTGYTFTGWNTASNGSGTDYADGATFAFSADDTLYAQWVKAAPPIVAANDAFVQPGDADGASSSTIVLKNAVNSASSSYNRVGYARFEFDPAYNWTNAAFEMMVSSNADGASNNGYNRSYTTFNVDVWAMSDASWDDTLRFSGADASVQDWGIDTSTWPWSPEGGTYLGTVSIPTLGSTVGQTYSLSNATLVTFLNSDADGEVTLFFKRSDLDNQANLSFASIENSTSGYHGPRLVAPSGSYSYTIAYDVNGGSGTLPSPGRYTVGSSAYTVEAPSSVTPPSGKTFSGWNSKADGSGTQYSVGSSYSTAASATLYAQFTTNPVVTFASNDGTSVSAYQAVTSGTATALTSNVFTRTGYTFSGWNTAANGSGTAYADGANITTSSAVTLYAQWTAASSGSSSGSSSSGGSSRGGGTSATSTPAPVVTPTVTRPTVRLPFPSPTPPRPTVLTAPAKTSTSGLTPSDRLVSHVGGVPAPVTTSTNGDDELSVSTSSLKLSLKMSQQSSVSETSDANAELTIKPGAKAAVTATGLLPNTTLQVWLPNVSERELGRLSVNAAGEIQGELGLSSSLGEDPLPVGRQTLQMTGYDAAGNQTVVEMPVNIAQGPPTPEPNRKEGALPDLSPGQSLGTSAGVPTTVVVTPFSDQRAVAVDGGDWSLSVALEDQNGEVGGTSESPLIRMTQSGQGVVTGDGFQPGTVASLWMFSEPTLLGTVTVAENGSFDAQFLVDAQFIPAGEHTLQVQGVGTDGYIKAANLGVLVDAAPVETMADSALTMIWWALAAAVVIALFVVILVSRRRRQA